METILKFKSVKGNHVLLLNSNQLRRFEVHATELAMSLGLTEKFSPVRTVDDVRKQSKKLCKNDPVRAIISRFDLPKDIKAKLLVEQACGYPKKFQDKINNLKQIYFSNNAMFTVARPEVVKC